MKKIYKIYDLPSPFHDYRVATITNKVKSLNEEVISFILIDINKNKKMYMFGLPKKTIKDNNELLSIIANNIETYIKIMENEK